MSFRHPKLRGKASAIGLHRAVAALILLALAACAAAPPAPTLPPNAPASALDVPFFPQETLTDCGPAALAMMLAWSGLEATPAGLAPEGYTPGREGTLQPDLVAAARRHQRLAVPVADLQALLAELAAGRPVLVLQNLGLAWWPTWHYAVATGFDPATGRLRLHSGTDRDKQLALEAFDRTWAGGERWALTVTRPDELPAAAGERSLLLAASGLEQAGAADAAGIAYGAILKRWPESPEALIGWGNARYAAGALPAAAAAFRQAVLLRPGAAAAWNNLAVTLSDLARYDEARAAAEEAIRLGGAHADAARETLQEIEAKRG
jgi:hypothetical protein